MEIFKISRDQQLVRRGIRLAEDLGRKGVWCDQLIPPWIRIYLHMSGKMERGFLGGAIESKVVYETVRCNTVKKEWLIP